MIKLFFVSRCGFFWFWHALNVFLLYKAIGWLKTPGAFVSNTGGIIVATLGSSIGLAIFGHIDGAYELYQMKKRAKHRKKR